MNLFRISYLFYPLPLVFFILNGSANLSGPRIGQTLGTLVVLFLVLGYWHGRPTIKKTVLKRMLDGLSVILISICAIAGKEINLEFAFLIILWPIIAYVTLNQDWLRVIVKLFQVTVLFCLIYFGINQYDFSNLLNSKVIWLFITFALQYFFIAIQFGWSYKNSMSKDLSIRYIAVLIGLATYSSLIFTPVYLLPLAMLSAPSVFILLKLVSIDGKESQDKYVSWFSFLSIAGMTLFNLYLFLDTTQVLQAVMGGY